MHMNITHVETDLADLLVPTADFVLNFNLMVICTVIVHFCDSMGHPQHSGIKV